MKLKMILSMFVAVAMMVGNVWAVNLPTEPNNAAAIEVPEASEAERQMIISRTASYFESEPPAISTLERTFDVNRDKRLQTLELKRYLFTVVNFVRNMKTLNYATPIINHFDDNQDGIIDLDEARYIEIALD